MKIPDSKNVACLLLDSKFKLITMNKEAENLLKCSVNKLQHHSVETLLAVKDEKTNLSAIVRDSFTSAELFVLRLHTHVDNNVLPLQWTFHKFLRTENNIDIILVTLGADSFSNVRETTRKIPELPPGSTSPGSTSPESTSQGSFILDRHKQLITYNPAWLVELGYNNSESTQSMDFMLSLVSPSDRNRIALLFYDEKYFNTHFRMASSGGVEVSVQASGISNGEDTVYGFLKIISNPVSGVEFQGELEYTWDSGCSDSCLHNINGEINSLAKSVTEKYHHHSFEHKHAASDLQLILSRIDLTEMIKILLQNAVEASAENALVYIQSGKQFYPQGHCVVCQKEIRGVKTYLSVKDSGHGISKEFLPYIFQNGFSTKKIVQNDFVGLHSGPAGLHRLQQLVHDNRGHILMETGGDFTRFIICFPEPIPSEESINACKKDKFCLMIVDDHPAVSRFLTKALDKESVQITSIFDPQSALKLIRQYPDQFDLIVTDLSMPGLAGDQLIEAIREVNSTLPLVLCSGENPHSLKTLALKEGVFGYLNKPISVSKLIKMVNSLRTRRFQEPITGTKEIKPDIQSGQDMSNVK